MKARLTSAASIFSFLMIFSNMVLAQQVTAGTTPDSFLYGLDVALDKISLLLTFDNTAKAQKGLLIAQERLLEVRAMVEQSKLDAAQRAQSEHANTLEEVKIRVENIQRANATDEIEDEIEIERELEEHESEIEKVKDELKVKIEIKGVITPEQQALIDSVLSSMENKTGEVKIKIDNKKGETKIKIKQQTGKSEIEIEQEIEEIEERKNVTAIRQERAIHRIEDAREEIADVREELAEADVAKINLTAVNELLMQAESHLLNAEEALKAEKFGEAFGQATAAERLAENAKRLLEGEDEIEIEREEVKSVKKETKEVEKAKTYTIEITPSGFSPNTLKIKSGDTVNFVNKDSSSHQPASNPHPIHTNYAGFDALKGLAQGENYSFTFTQKGTFGYHDHLNPSVGGTITVE